MPFYNVKARINMTFYIRIHNVANCILKSNKMPLNIALVLLSAFDSSINATI